MSLELSTLLYHFSEEKGCSVIRVRCPPLEVRDARAAVAGLVVDLPWVGSFSYRFRHPQHINLLELEALISLIRGSVDRGVGHRRVLCLVDRRVVLGAVCEGRSSSRRVNFRLRRLRGLLLVNNLSLDLLGTLLCKPQRCTIALLLGMQVAGRSSVVLSTIARHPGSSS